MKFKIVIIGAGRVAYSLTAALVKAEYIVGSIISRNLNSAETLAKRFKIKHYSDKLSDIPKSAHLILLTVPDDQILVVTRKLSKLNLNFKKLLFVHLSGSKNINVLRSLKSKGAKTATMHIMKAFASRRVLNFLNTPAAIEADTGSDYKLLESFTLSLNLTPFKIDSKHKQFYHLAGVFSLNFLAGNLHSMKQLLALHNIDELEYLKSFGSTINSMVKSISKNGSANALSGPVERGDLETISSHITELKKLYNKPGDEYYRTMLKNYVVQSLNLLYLIEEKYGHLNESHLEVRDLLKKELKSIDKTN